MSAELRFEQWATGRMLGKVHGSELTRGYLALMGAWRDADLTARVKILKLIRPEIRP